MRKLMILAAMLAMVLAAAVPALAQDATAGDETNTDNSTTTEENTDVGIEGDGNQLSVNDCEQILNNNGDIDQYGANASVSGDGNDVAVGGNNAEVTAAQLEYCQNYLVEIQDGYVSEDNGSEPEPTTPEEPGDEEGDEGASAAAAAAAAAAAVAGEGEGAAASAAASAGADEGTAAAAGAAAVSAVEGIHSSHVSDDVLPDTGGYSLIALGAGALLVAGGLVARRIVR